MNSSARPVQWGKKGNEMWNLNSGVSSSGPHVSLMRSEDWKQTSVLLLPLTAGGAVNTSNSCLFTVSLFV